MLCPTRSFNNHHPVRYTAIRSYSFVAGRHCILSDELVCTRSISRDSILSMPRGVRLTVNKTCRAAEELPQREFRSTPMGSPGFCPRVSLTNKHAGMPG